jgi:hypothetical protein
MLTIDCGICCRDAKRAAVRDPSEERGEMHHQKNGEQGQLTGSLVSAAMLAPAESSITELTLVLLLGSQRRLSHC